MSSIGSSFLNDAPLAWQLCLHSYIMELGGVRSQLDAADHIREEHVVVP